MKKLLSLFLLLNVGLTFASGYPHPSQMSDVEKITMDLRVDSDQMATILTNLSYGGNWQVQNAANLFSQFDFRVQEFLINVQFNINTPQNTQTSFRALDQKFYEASAYAYLFNSSWSLSNLYRNIVREIYQLRNYYRIIPPSVDLQQARTVSENLSNEYKQIQTLIENEYNAFPTPSSQHILALDLSKSYNISVQNFSTHLKNVSLITKVEKEMISKLISDHKELFKNISQADFSESIRERVYYLKKNLNYLKKLIYTF